MDVDELFQGLDVAREPVLEFFILFARFEFALKEAGYVFDQHGHAAPDWRRYRAEVSEHFKNASTAENSVIDELIELAPMRQVFDANHIQWVPIPLEGKPATRALTAAAQVRNNLFHGGKHTPHSPPGRDQRLVELSIAMIRSCLRLSPRVREKFEEPQRN